MNTRTNNNFITHLIWLACLLAGAVYFYTQGKVVSDISQFMPQTSRHAQLNILLSEIQQGAASRYLMIRIQGKDDVTSANLSRELKSTLLKSNLFTSVQNGEAEFQPNEFRQLYAYRYLLMTTQGFSAPELRTALKNRVTDLSSGMGLVLQQTLTSDPQNHFIHYLSRLNRQGQPPRHLGVWFDRTQQGAMMLVSLAGRGFDLDQQDRAISLLKSRLRALPDGRTARLEISGPATMAVATRAAIQSSMRYLSVISGGLMLLLFIWAYRSLKFIVVASLPLASAILAALVVTNILFGEVHGIVIAFGITLLGVCLDMPLHLFSHLNQCEAPRQTLLSIWPTLRLSVITTAFSYVALLGTGFAGLSQLAVFAITGLTTALLVTRWIVPSWLRHGDGGLRHAAIRIGSLRFSARLKYVLIAVGTVLPMIILVTNSSQLWSRDIASLSPVPEAARQLDQHLRAQMAVPGMDHAFFVTATSAEAVLEKVEALRPVLASAQAEGLVKHVFAVSDVLPSQKTQRLRQQQLPDHARLMTALSEAMRGLPFKKTAFEDFVRDVEHSKTLRPLTWQGMQQTPLAAVVKQAMFVRHGQWMSVLRVSGIADQQRFQAWLNDRPALAAQYLNMRSASSELMLTYQQTALARLMIGIVFIAVVVGVMMRSSRKMWRVVLPIVLAVLLTISLQVLMGTELTLFHILSLLLVVGMGLDYSLFFNRPLGSEQDLNMRTHGVMMSAASTLAAFGVLAFAGIPVLAAMGQTVSIGVLCCYVLSQLLAEPENESESGQQDKTAM